MNEREVLEQLQVDFINLGWDDSKPARPLESLSLFNKLHNGLALALNDTTRAEQLSRAIIDEARQAGQDQQWVARELTFEITLALAPEDRQQVAKAFLDSGKGSDQGLDLYLQRIKRQV
ncbi:hypothetical protein [Spirosoma fluminis]